MTHPVTCSFAEFAAIGNFKRSYVTELRKAGRLVLTDDARAVRVPESLALIDATRDPSKAGVAARHAAERAARGDGQGAPAAAPPRDGEAEDDADVPVTTGYQQWRERSERAKALGLERENEIADGKLLDAAAVESAIAAAVVQFRATIENLPNDLAPELAPITEESQVRALLIEAFERALNDLSRQFAGVAKAAAA